jgi:molybdopterin molybdotransferase
MIQLEEAIGQILAVVPKPVAEPVLLSQARGRILFERISAAVDLPPFDNSAVDGYAVRLADVAPACPAAPARLRLAGRVPAGSAASGPLPPGACIRVGTGAPIPDGAEAVVMQEDTRIKPDRPEEVLVLEPARLRENVRLRGEDVAAGAPLIEAGESLTIGRMTLLAAAGVSRVTVGRRPRVGVLATGSELREPEEPLGAGQIHEGNRIGLAGLIEEAGGAAQTFPIVPDALEATRAALERAFHECDLVITCGGVSVGEMDFVKAAFQRLGGVLQFSNVAIKPGKPFAFGRCGSKCLFGLPGNPVSAFVTFLLLVRPAVLRCQGAADISLSAYPGVLAEPLSNGGPRRHFMRVSMDGAGRVRSAGIQASHIVSCLASANGLVDVGPQAVLPAGAPVQVLRWE